jgi:hypothetical protein
MLLFDWKKVFDTAEGNISLCNLIMEMLIKKQIPRNKYDYIFKYYQLNFAGTSFLLHPEFLLYNAYKYTPRELCVYYGLASLRNYSDYMATGKTTLDPLHCPVDLETLKDNRLLIISENEITLIYEEVTLETIH